MTPDEITIRSIFTSFAYISRFDYMAELSEEVKNRVLKWPCDHTYDGDIIYGFLVLLYGEYGVSPRAGWIYEENVDEIIKYIDHLIEEYKYLEEFDDV